MTNSIYLLWLGLSRVPRVVVLIVQSRFPPPPPPNRSKLRQLLQPKTSHQRRRANPKRLQPPRLSPRPRRLRLKARASPPRTSQRRKSPLRTERELSPLQLPLLGRTRQRKGPRRKNRQRRRKRGHLNLL